MAQKAADRASTAARTEDGLAPMILLYSALAVLVVMTTAYLVGRQLRRHNVVDVAWGLGFTAVALVAALTGDGKLRWLMFALVAIWGLRLAGYLAWRSRGKGEDPRYAAMLARAGGHPEVAILVRIYLTQAALVWFISLPVQAASVSDSTVSWVVALGVLLWTIGVAFESVGDAQLARFKAQRANRGQIMDRGLWSWTRHPNYFGDACVWWGLFLVAASGWPGVLTVLSPIVMTVLVTRVSGRDLLEKHMRGRPGFADYLARTSGFFPRPPRHDLTKPRGSRARTSRG